MFNQTYSSSTYQLKKVVLLESNFNVPSIDYEHGKEVNLSIGINKTEPDENDMFEVTIRLEVDCEGNDTSLVVVAFVGKFQKLKESEDLDLDYFSRVNAPAIIYPYIRQHIRTLTLEAGFSSPIILPIINFVDLGIGNDEGDE